MLQSLRVENNQLRQLNKFLEERVGGYERMRAQGLYQAAVAQQAALLQQQQQQVVAVAAPPLGAAGAGAGTPAPVPLASSMPSGEIETCSSSAPLGAAPMSAATGTVPPGMMLVSMPVTAPAMPGVVPDAAGMQALALKQASLVEQQAALVGAGVPIALPAGAPPVGWLPPSDVVRDGQLRPPAA